MDSPDLLVGGTERQRWRPPRTARRAALVVVALAVASGAFAALADRARSERAKDRAAVARLRLAADQSAATFAHGVVPVAIRNEGPDPVKVVDGRLDQPGFVFEPLGVRLPSGGSVTLDVPDRVPCTPSLLTTPPDSIVVRLSTYRGTRVTRTLPLSPGAFADVDHAARARCGYLPADEAFGVHILGVTTSGTEVVVRTRVENDSVLPFRLDRVNEPPGVAITVLPAVPLLLPKQPRPGAVSRSVTVVFRLQVTSCASLVASVPELLDATTAWLVRDATVSEVPLFDSSQGATRVALVDAIASLDRQCGA